jgi:hypothetical protein
MINGTEKSGWMDLRKARQADPERTANESPFKLPDDLGNWASPDTLLEWITTEVNKLDWGDAAVQDFLRRQPENRPKAMICLLAYAYASGMFGAEEIVNLCYADPVYRRLCEGKAPLAQELFYFRRENRELLKRILYRVFFRAVRERFQLTTILLPRDLEQYLREAAAERLNVARHVDCQNE